MTSLAPSAVERTDSRGDEALALAELLAHPTHPRPFLIDADNLHAGMVPSVAEAHATGRTFAVTVAPDVLAFDLDDPTAAEASHRLADELRAEGHAVLRAESGRPGHRHLFAVVPDRVDRERMTRRADALGLPPPRTVIRPPASPHRLGLPVDVLDDPDDFAATADAARTTTTDRLDWRHLLATGRWPRGWTGEGSPSSKAWLIAIGAIRAGDDLATVTDWLADPANAGGSAYRRRLGRSGKQHADYWLTHYVWPSAVEAAGKRPTPPADADEARERLCALADAIDAHPWAGVAGATDRAVLAALVARGMARGSTTPHMSHREIAEAAPCSRRTVPTAIRRLMVGGWLQVAERGRGRTVIEAGEYREQTRATRWRLLTPARAFPTGGTPPSCTQLNGASTRAPSPARLDVCRWRGFGLNAPRVLDTLLKGPRTTAELAEILDLDRGNLRVRALPKLAAHGLIVRSGDLWHLADDLDDAMTRAADELDLTGKAAAVAAKHAAEREEYLDARERRRPERKRARAAAVDADVISRRARRARVSDVDDLDTYADELDATGAPPPPPSPTPLFAVAGDGHAS
jgi:hypothetical protein